MIYIYFILLLSLLLLLISNNIVICKMTLYDIYEKYHESKYDLEVHYKIKELNVTTKITSISYVYDKFNEINNNNNNINLIDDVIYYVINLDKRLDRLQNFLLVFLDTKLPTKNLYKLSAIDHYYGPLGCALSHIIVLDQFMSRHSTAKHLVVLEDDIKFIDHSLQFGKYYNLKVIYDDIYNSNYEWDFILLTPSKYLQDNLTEYLDYNENTKKYKRYNNEKELLLKLIPYHSTTSAGYITKRSYINKLEANLINSCIIMILYLEHMPLKYLDEAALDRQWIELANKPESRWYVLKIPIASVNDMLGSDINKFISVSTRNEIEVNNIDSSHNNDEAAIHAPITIKGLGRQLFIIWTTIAFARKYNKPYAFWDMKRKPWKTYWNNFFKNIDIIYIPWPNFHYAYRDPNDFTYKSIRNFNNSFTINGYFQSYLHFDEIYDEIYSTLITKANTTYINDANKLVNQLRSSAENRKCIYVHINQKIKILETTNSKNLKKDYYSQAIRKFDRENFFIVFHNSQGESDNEFVQEVEIEIKKYTGNYVFVQNIKYENYIIMLAMIQMDGAIIANSAYSWWIAYLMDNYKNKTVVLPSIWYTNNVTEYHKKLNHWIMI